MMSKWAEELEKITANATAIAGGPLFSGRRFVASTVFECRAGGEWGELLHWRDVRGRGAPSCPSPREKDKDDG